MTSSEAERRFKRLENVMFGNGREGLDTRFTRVETILQRVDAFMNQVKYIVIGQVVAFFFAVAMAFIL